MGELNKQTIKNLTRLSRISCSEQEEDKLLDDLKKILNYIDQLNQVDTENVLPCSHVLEGMANVTREDAVGATLPREDFLKNAPSHTGGLIRVPPVLK